MKKTLMTKILLLDQKVKKNLKYHLSANFFINACSGQTNLKKQSKCRKAGSAKSKSPEKCTKLDAPVASAHFTVRSKKKSADSAFITHTFILKRASTLLNFKRAKLDKYAPYLQDVLQLNRGKTSLQCSIDVSFIYNTGFTHVCQVQELKI